MKVSIINPLKDPRWDKFINSQTESTIFHTSVWARVIQDTYKYTPYYYVLEEETGELKAGIPLFLISSVISGKRLVCLPFSDYCFPLGEESAIAVLLDSAKNEVNAGTASYMELRGWQNGKSPTQPDLKTRDYYLLYMIDLEQGIESLRNSFHHSIKRGIHQAEQRGVTVRITRAEEDMEHFYKLNLATRKKLGVLPQPKAFFTALYRHVISENMGFLVLAESEGKVIAGILFLTYNDTIYYKFNASDESQLQKRPNHLAMWEALKNTDTAKYKHFDFGRCSPEEEGLRTFKARWGAKEIKLPYYFYPEIKGFTTVSENSLRYKTMRFFSRIMPKFMFKAAGSLLYKHLA
jgi:hypothetical protein